MRVCIVKLYADDTRRVDNECGEHLEELIVKYINIDGIRVKDWLFGNIYICIYVCSYIY